MFSSTLFGRWNIISGRPPKTPLPALISGPAAGDPWPGNDPAPQPISDEWFEVVYPLERRNIINTREYKPGLKNAGGREVFETWRKALNGPEPCIEIQSASLEEDSYGIIPTGVRPLDTGFRKTDRNLGQIQSIAYFSIPQEHLASSKTL